MAGAQAADYADPDRLSPVSQTVYEAVREVVPAVTEDRLLTDDFDAVGRITERGDLIDRVEAEHGEEILSLDLPG